MSLIQIRGLNREKRRVVLSREVSEDQVGADPAERAGFEPARSC